MGRRLVRRKKETQEKEEPPQEQAPEREPPPSPSSSSSREGLLTSLAAAYESDDESDDEGPPGPLGGVMGSIDAELRAHVAERERRRDDERRSLVGLDSGQLLRLANDDDLTKPLGRSVAKLQRALDSPLASDQQRAAAALGALRARFLDWYNGALPDHYFVRTVLPTAGVSRLRQPNYAKWPTRSSRPTATTARTATTATTAGTATTVTQRRRRRRSQSTTTTSPRDGQRTSRDSGVLSFLPFVARSLPSFCRRLTTVHGSNGHATPVACFVGIATTPGDRQTDRRVEPSCMNDRRMDGQTQREADRQRTKKSTEENDGPRS